MKKLTILLFVLLTGCASSVAVKMSFPDVPDNLKTACPDLKTVDESTTKLSEVIGVVSSNYSEYYTCKDRVDNWVEWYNNQKKIFDSVK
jgi:hypothetical protein